jgi:hypothetical protein
MAENGKQLVIDYRQIGATGLRRFSGFIYEEFLQELTGWRGAQVYKEMSTNDSTIKGILYAIDKLIRKVPWNIQPASDQPCDKEAAEFLEGCMNDMDMPWIETIAEILSMLTYGYSVHEIVYKRRCGDGFDPTMRSKFSDGRIGWRGFPIRSQDTIYRWQFDDHGGIQGVEQLAPPHYYHVTIPVEKFLLFRTTVHKNNPEGESILRGAYRSWYMKKNIENIEAIGIERDLAGLPCAYVPAEMLSVNASDAEKALLAAIKQLVTNVRRDEQEGLVLPMQYDVNGKPLYDFKLLSTGGSRQLDVDKVINRYDQRIAMTCLADFLLIGHQNVGSFSLVSDRRELFASSLGAFLDIIAEILNRYAVPRLFALNDFEITDYPKFIHGDIESVDLEKLSKYLLTLSQAGMPLGPDSELDKYLRKVAHLPEQVDQMNELDQQPEIKQPEQYEDIKEIPGLPIQTPTGLEQPADTTPVNNKPPVETVTTNVDGNTERTSRAAASRLQTPAQYTRWDKW